jgi:NTE family protein
LVATARVRDGQLRIFRNDEITADVVLASTCPPLIHRSVEIDGEAYWDGTYVANPPLLQLVQDTSAVDLLVVQITPSFDGTVPVTLAAIDRRLDRILSNATLNTETSALDLVRQTAPQLGSLRMTRIVAEDEVDGLAERTATDMGRGFIKMLHQKARQAADRWLSQDRDQMLPRSLRQPPRDEFDKQLFEIAAPLAETMSASVSPPLM